MALDSSLVPNPLGANIASLNQNQSYMGSGKVGEGGNGTTGFESVLGGHGATVDSAIWIMSVLFCSVLCFGQGERAESLAWTGREGTRGMG